MWLVLQQFRSAEGFHTKSCSSSDQAWQINCQLKDLKYEIFIKRHLNKHIAMQHHALSMRILHGTQLYIIKYILFDASISGFHAWTLKSQNS